MVPEKWKVSGIVPILKKRDPSVCGNYRGIALMSLAAKLCNRILLNRIQLHTEPLLWPNQNGFRTFRSTTQHILALKRSIEECTVKKECTDFEVEAGVLQSDTLALPCLLLSWTISSEFLYQTIVLASWSQSAYFDDNWPSTWQTWTLWRTSFFYMALHINLQKTEYIRIGDFSDDWWCDRGS